jgi:hypothetical protein
MYDKRRYFALASLAACAVLAGCASTTAGTASFAGPKASAPTLPSGLPTGGSSSVPTAPSGSSSSDEPSSVPTSDVPTTEAPTDNPPAGPTTRTSGKVNLEDDGAICQLISAADLKKIWGQAPRTFPDSSGPSCTYKNADGDQIIIGEYASSSSSEQVSGDLKGSGAKKVTTTVGGRPAVILLDKSDYGDGYWYVSETKDFNAPGAIMAYVDKDPRLQKIAKAMLAKIVPKYAH